MGKIVTFYSYKGGTGRSMALANVAWVLASNGQRVLAVDWDLEAPGLHRYFRPFLVDKELTGPASQGVIDFMIDFAVRLATPAGPDDCPRGDWYRSYADISKWSKRLSWPCGETAIMGRAGTIDFVPAGRQDAQYAKRVNSFDWAAFYEHSNGGAFIDALRRSMAAYDWVLIDSRTGVSDTSGICTVQLPDVLVVCFTLNYQSIEGSAAVAASVRALRPAIRILPVPMRIDGSEEKLLKRMKKYAQDVFTAFLDPDIAPSEYWLNMEVPYFARYAYSEKLAPFEDQVSISTSTLPAVERITAYVTNGAVTKLVPLPEEHRKAALEEFERMPEDAEVERTPSALPAPWRLALHRSLRWIALHKVLLLLSVLIASVALNVVWLYWKSRTPDAGTQIAALTAAARRDIQTGQRALRSHAALLVAEAAIRLDPNTPIGAAAGPGGAVAEALFALQPLRVGSVRHNGPVYVVRFSPDGQLVATASGDGTATVFRADGQPIPNPWKAPNSGRAIAFSPDGRYLASGGRDGSTLILDSRSFSEVVRVPGNSTWAWVNAVVFSPNGRMFAAGTEMREIIVFGVDPWRPLAKIAEQAGVLSLAYSPDSLYVAAGTMGSTVHFWSYQQAGLGVPVEILGPHKGPVRMVVFAPTTNPRRLATASTDGNVRLWTQTPGIPDLLTLATGSDVYAVAFSPDGRLLAGGNRAGQALLWSVPDGKPVASLPHGADVRALAFSPDGRWLATGSGDATARIWDVASGRELERIAMAREVNSVAFSPDARYMATADADGLASTWLVLASGQQPTLSAREALRLACSQAGDVPALSISEWQQYFGAEPYRTTCAVHPASPPPQVLGKLMVRVTAKPSRVAPGEKTTINLMVTDNQGRAVPDAAVTLRSGGGRFLESANASFDPGGRLQSLFDTTGQTTRSGGYQAWWVCNPCAPGYVIEVEASKQGYDSATGQVAVSVLKHP